MYTGITKGLFRVSAVEKQPGLLTYVVDFSEKLVTDLEIGASVAINGVCQTVTNIDHHQVTFQAMQETLAKTTLAQLQVNDYVSVERSVKIGEENGGHAMYGHVDGMATVVARDVSDNNLCLTLALAPHWMMYVYDKGFIGLDGSSLTVCNVDYIRHTIQVNLIPQTLALTNFKHKQIGDRVNVELDAQAKALANIISNIPVLKDLQQRVTALENKINA